MPTSTPSETRAALIEHALAGLLELTPAQLLSAVGLKDVAGRAGVGVTTIYHHFGNLQGFADAVVQRVFDPEVVPSGTIAALIDEITKGRFPFEQSRTLHHAEFERLSSDPELRLRMGLWALGGQDTAAAYRQFLHATEETLRESVGVMLEAWHREPQPPFDLASTVAAQVALTNSASVRHQVDPGVIDVERFARMAAALSTALTRRVGDPRTLDDRLTETNYYPLQAARSRAASPERRSRHGHILDAAVTLFDRSGYEQATIPQLAKHADVSPSTVYALFSGIGDVAVALLQRQAAEQLGRDDATPDDPLAALLHTVERVAAFLTPRVGFLAPYGERLLCGTVDDDAIVGVLADALAVAQTQGLVRTDLDPTRTGRVICGQLIGAAMARPSAGTTTAVQEFESLLLPGLRSPSA